MTRDKIEILWQQAMTQAVKDGEMFTRYRFAKLVAAAEREACAQASEQQIERWVDDRARYAASECAAAIRARSST